MNPRILIVDDEPSVRECVALILANKGYELEGASNGEEALATCQSRPFDLVLTDMTMAGMDGLTLLTRLRQINSDQSVILMTASPPADTSLFDAVALKPFSAQDLRTRVSAVVSAKRQHLMSQNSIATGQACTITVLLADDHPLLREGLRLYLAAEPDVQVVAEASNGEEVIEKAQALHPNVVIMDIGMPVMNGLDATRRLREVAPDVKVLVLTGHESRELTFQAAVMGARGYISKGSPRSELMTAIRTIHRGDVHFPTPVATAFLKSYQASHHASQPVRPEALTKREREVLALITDGVPNKRVALKLGLSVRTIEKHRQRIMKKLNLHSAVDLTRYAIKERLVLRQIQVDKQSSRRNESSHGRTKAP